MIDEQLEYIESQIRVLEQEIKDIESEGIDNTDHMRHNAAIIESLERKIMGWVHYQHQLTDNL